MKSMVQYLNFNLGHSDHSV